MIQCPSSILVGDAGTGKSHALRTLLDVADEVCVILLEQNAAIVLGDTPKDRFHWYEVSPPDDGDDAFLDHLDKVNSMSFEMLSKQRGINKESHNQLIQIYKATMNFKCSRCGKEMGNWRKFDHRTAVAIDGLTELAKATMELQTGSQPVKAVGDYGVAQSTLEAFLQKFCYELKCWRVMTAHPRIERDELRGSRVVYPASVGTALLTTVPKMFGNVIKTERLGKGRFNWNTLDPDWILKATGIEWAEEIPPTFSAMQAYLKEHNLIQLEEDA